VFCAKAARFAANQGLTGAEFLAGIPGTIGGALAMNAGAYGGEIWDVVKLVNVLNRKGECLNRIKADFNIAYRSVSITEDEWFISCIIKLQLSSKELCNEKIRKLLAERAKQQPLGQLSCGSVFRNPENDHAARLIDTCGLKGTSIGDARVSEKHANFIVNTGNATSSDIEKLIELIRSTVLDSHGIEIQTEVKIIGETGSDRPVANTEQIN